MNAMDYEKAYKDAFETANKWIEDGCTDKVRICLECVFPELAVSEDERTRKGIIEIIKAVSGPDCDVYLDEKKQEKYLAWLEKQKEQKPVEIHIDNPNIQKVDHDVKISTSDSSAGGDELLYVSQKSYNIGYRDGVASVKPAEWSEEDERKRQACISTINDVIDYERERWEDYNPGKPYRPIMKYDEQMDWLKSLRPSWKPSEEQMKALQNAVALTSCDKELVRLYNQLKTMQREESER